MGLHFVTLSFGQGIQRQTLPVTTKDGPYDAYAQASARVERTSLGHLSARAGVVRKAGSTKVYRFTDDHTPGAVDRHAESCPCGQIDRDEIKECAYCEAFVCAHCGLLTSWDDGADDELPDGCQECWSKGVDS